MLNGVLLSIFLKGKIGKTLSICARLEGECRYVEVLPCFTSNIYYGIISKRTMECLFIFMGALHMDQALSSISII